MTQSFENLIFNGVSDGRRENVEYATRKRARKEEVTEPEFLQKRHPVSPAKTIFAECGPSFEPLSGPGRSGAQAEFVAASVHGGPSADESGPRVVGRDRAYPGEGKFDQVASVPPLQEAR